METVYRLETPNGTGVYRVCGSGIVEKHISRSGQDPSPHCEGEPFHEDNPFAPPKIWIQTSPDGQIRARRAIDRYYFGFSSIDQMLAWFSPACIEEIMCKTEVRPVVYRVPFEAIAWGNKQIAFRRDLAVGPPEPVQIPGVSVRHADASDRPRDPAS